MKATGQEGFAPPEPLESLSGWKAYLERLIEILNTLPELKPILDKSAPVVFQYRMHDFSEYNYWYSFQKDGIKWELGENTEENIPKVIHKASLEIIKKINAGEIHPVQAKVDGIYSIDGDMRKLMECTPLLPLLAKAHALATTGSSAAKKVGPAFRHKTDLETLYTDIVKAAEISEVAYDSNIIHKVLNVYKDFFSGSTITFTTNTVPKEKRRLAVRYVEFQVPHDPYTMALSAGLLETQGHPI
ncbi:MAG TPA: aromatic prenyltransferase, partial [Anaerolineales bacterium]|nr:aromatic prenyltransferase [Anaerolineales bacterium]